MSLVCWLPLLGNTNNQGLSGYTMNGSPASWSDGKIGKCATFNGSISNVIYNNTTDFNYTDNFSFCMWINHNFTSSNAQYAFTVGRVDYGDGRGYGIQILSTSTIRFWFGARIEDIACPANEWHHIAVTISGTIIKIYKDGILYTTSTTATLPTYSDGNGLGIGCFHFNGGDIYPYYGSINDFRLYNHALSALEVKQISQGLVCHYKLSSQYETGQVNKYSGDVAEGYLYTGSFTRTKLEDERGYNYKITYTGTGSNNWLSMTAGNFSFTAGKRYYYSCKVRCHSTNFSMALRASRSDNDWVTNMVNVLNPDGEWHEYVVPQTINSTYDRVGSTLTCNPILEFYTESLVTSGKVYSADFDIKDVQVIESDCYVPFIDNRMTSTVVSDCSGYGNNGTKVGTIAWSGDSAKYSGSYDFNGTGYIKNNSFNLNATEITISFWVKIPKTTTSQHFLFGTFNDWTSNGIGYWRDTNNSKYEGILRSSAESSHVGLATPSLTADIWYHIVIVYTGTECILYVNGTENKRVTYGKNGTIVNPVCYLGNSLFNGTPSSETDESSVSDFRIYATALSAEDIKSLYNVSATIDKTGVLSAYEFIEEE